MDTIKNLRNALNRFQEDDSCSVAILGGVSGNFCSGYDLNELIIEEGGRHKLNWDNLLEMLWPLGTRLTQNKITIAAVEGHAAGFGYELTLKCDFRVADRDARMGFLNRRLGIPIMNGGTVILPQLVGLTRAKELIGTGKGQLAPEALQYGCLNYMADVGCALGRSINLARCLAKFDQTALLHDLSALNLYEEQTTIDKLTLERNRSLDYFKQCDDFQMVGQFLKGRLGRHGNFDMGNSLTIDPEVTL